MKSCSKNVKLPIVLNNFASQSEKRNVLAFTNHTNSVPKEGKWNFQSKSMRIIGLQRGESTARRIATLKHQIKTQSSSESKISQKQSNLDIFNFDYKWLLERITKPSLNFIINFTHFYRDPISLTETSLTNLLIHWSFLKDSLRYSFVLFIMHAIQANIICFIPFLDCRGYYDLAA
jgi:hypothetical protein